MPNQFAIVWNARYDPKYDMDWEEGIIEENMKSFEEFGALFWDHKWKRGFPYDGPFTGYIRDCMTSGWLTHRVTVEKVYRITSDNENPIPSHEKRYIPDYRKPCYEGRRSSGEPHERSQVWFKITDLRPLSKPVSMKELIRWNDPSRPYERNYFRKYIKIVDRNYR